MPGLPKPTGLSRVLWPSAESRVSRESRESMACGDCQGWESGSGQAPDPTGVLKTTCDSEYENALAATPAQQTCGQVLISFYWLSGGYLQGLALSRLRSPPPQLSQLSLGIRPQSATPWLSDGSVIQPAPPTLPSHIPAFLTRPNPILCLGPTPKGMSQGLHANSGAGPVI